MLSSLTTLAEPFKMPVGAITCVGGCREVEEKNGCQIDAGGTCSVTAWGSCRQVTNSTQRMLFVPSAVRNELTSFYSNPPDRVKIESNCAINNSPCNAVAATWLVSGKECAASLAAGNYDDNQSATDNTAPVRGSASFRCAGGNWVVQPGATCASDGCIAGAMSWTVGSATCDGTIAAGADDDSRSLNDNSTPTLGAATYKCQSDSWVLQGGSSCAAQGCNGATLSWATGSINCSASVSSTAHGQSATVSENSSTRQGNAEFYCNGGSWQVTNSNCSERCTPEDAIRQNPSTNVVEICKSGVWVTKPVITYCLPPREVKQGDDEWMTFHQADTNRKERNAPCTNDQRDRSKHADLNTPGRIRYDDKSKSCANNSNCIDK